jgi:hypothetical protein
VRAYSSSLHRPVITATLLVFLPLSAPGTGLSRSADRPDRQAQLTVRAIPGFQVPGFQKAVSASKIWDAADTTSELATWIAADFRGPCSNTLLASAGGIDPATPPNDADFRNASVVWAFQARLVEMGEDEATFDVRWRREVRRAGLAAESSVPIEQRLVLREGAEGIFDVVRAEGTTEDVCSTFALGLQLTFVGRTDVQEAGLEYDVWLVNRAPDGTQSAVRTMTSGAQGEGASFLFRPLSVRAEGLTPVERLRMNVSGRVVGRARRDGSIDLAVETGRSLMQEDRSNGFAGSGGRKRLIVQPDETVEFELPALAGNIHTAQAAALLKGHRTAIRITARRLW